MILQRLPILDTLAPGNAHPVLCQQHQITPPIHVRVDNLQPPLQGHACRSCNTLKANKQLEVTVAVAAPPDSKSLGGGGRNDNVDQVGPAVVVQISQEQDRRPGGGVTSGQHPPVEPTGRRRAVGVELGQVGPVAEYHELRRPSAEDVEPPVVVNIGSHRCHAARPSHRLAMVEGARRRT